MYYAKFLIACAVIASINAVPTPQISSDVHTNSFGKRDNVDAIDILRKRTPGLTSCIKNCFTGMSGSTGSTRPSNPAANTKPNPTPNPTSPPASPPPRKPTPQELLGDNYGRVNNWVNTGQVNPPKKPTPQELLGDNYGRVNNWVQTGQVTSPKPADAQSPKKPK